MGDPERTRAQDESDPAIAAQLAEIRRIHMDVYGRIEEFARRVFDAEDAQQILQDSAAQLWLRWTRNPLAFTPPDNPQKYAERKFAPEMGDRFIRWTALDGREERRELIELALDHKARNAAA